MERPMSRNCLLFSAFILMACHMARADDAKWSEWKNSLASAGNPGEPITLVENGQAKYSILIPATPTTQDKKAAEDLQHWVAETTGTSLEITDKQTPDKNYISIGNTAMEMLSSRAQSTLGEEGYEIEQRRQNLVLTGGST